MGGRGQRRLMWRIGTFGCGGSLGMAALVMASVMTRAVRNSCACTRRRMGGSLKAASIVCSLKNHQMKVDWFLNWTGRCCVCCDAMGNLAMVCLEVRKRLTRN